VGGNGRKVGVLTKSVTVADLRPYFEMTLEDAALEFGASVAHMKRLCRKCNIKKWPYRQLKGIMETITQLQEAHENPLCNFLERKKIESRIQCLQERRKKIITDPANLDSNSFSYAQEFLHDIKVPTSNNPSSFNARHGKVQQEKGENLTLSHFARSLTSFPVHGAVKQTASYPAIGNLLSSSNVNDPCLAPVGIISHDPWSGQMAKVPNSVEVENSNEEVQKQPLDISNLLPPFRHLRAMVMQEGTPRPLIAHGGCVPGAKVPFSAAEAATAYFDGLLGKFLTGFSNCDPAVVVHYQHILAILHENARLKERVLELEKGQESLAEYVKHPLGNLKEKKEHESSPTLR